MSIELCLIIIFACFLWIAGTGVITSVVGLLRYFGEVEPLVTKETLEQWVRDEIPKEIRDQMWRGESEPPKLKPVPTETTEEKKGEKK
jgi:hypothetical protein